MKLQSLAALALAAAAFGASAAGNELVLSRTRSDTASVFLFTADPGRFAQLSVRSADDFTTGQLSGSISVILRIPTAPFFQTLSCEGPAFANILVVNPANGDTTIRAMLDPSAQDCRGLNISEPLAIDLTGRSDGNVHVSQDGDFTIQTNLQVIRGRSTQDSYTNIFEGSVSSFSGTITGSVIATRNFRQDQQCTGNC
jgi:hypothetical protein